MSAVRILAAALLCLGLLGLASPLLSLQLEHPRYDVTIGGPSTETLPAGATAVSIGTLRAEHEVQTTSRRIHVRPDDPFSLRYDADQWAAATELRQSDYVAFDGSYRSIRVDRRFPRRRNLGRSPTLFLLTVGAALLTAGVWIGYAESVVSLTPERGLLAPVLGFFGLVGLYVLDGVALRPWILTPEQTAPVVGLLAGVPLGAALAHRRWRWAAPLLAVGPIVAYNPVFGFARSEPVQLWVSLPILAIPWFPFVATGVVLSPPFARFVGPVWGPLAERLGIEWNGPA